MRIHQVIIIVLFETVSFFTSLQATDSKSLIYLGQIYILEYFPLMYCDHWEWV